MARLVFVLLLVFTVTLCRGADDAAIRFSVSPAHSVLSSGTIVILEADSRAGAGQTARIEIFNGPFLLATRETNYLSIEAMLRDGTNTFFAVAYDVANVARTSAVHTVRGNLGPIMGFDRLPGVGPIVGLLEPVVIWVSAVDLDGTIQKVDLLVNGQRVATDVEAPFQFSYQPPEFGTYAFAAVAVDNDGATGNTGAPYRLTFSRAADSLSGGVAPLLVGTNITLVDSTVGATRDKNEPLHAGMAGGKSVWWRWEAPRSGTVTIDTIGSDFDTLLAIYQSGDRTVNITNLVPVAANDDDLWARPASKVKFSAAAKTMYYIAVDGSEGVAGTVKLQLKLSAFSGPENDMLGAATRWGPIWSGTNIGATKEEGEPAHAGNVGGASIWIRFDNSISTSPVEISTEGSSFDTLLAVYTNSAVPRIALPPFPMSNLRLVASNDDGSGGVTTSKLTFTPGSYGTYWVAVDGYNGAEGRVTLRIRGLGNEPQVRPQNDNFANAALLTGGAAVTVGNSRWATAEFGEPRHAGRAPAKSVWWRWTAPTNGIVYVSTKGSEFDTVLAVYRGTRVDALSSVASNDDDSAALKSSAVIFNAIGGTEYHIAVGGYEQVDGGPVVLAVNQYGLPTAPRLVSQFLEGALSIRVEGASDNLILESSGDLKTWKNVGAITASEAAEIRTMTSAPQQYYRARVAE